MIHVFSDVCLRPEIPSDEMFLALLFASSHAEDVASVCGGPAARETLLRLERLAQKRFFETAYPMAERTVVLVAGVPAGRMIVDRLGRNIVLVDLVLSPEHRGRGIGTALLSLLLAEADRTGRGVKAHVPKTSRAVRLYRRLGFVRTDATAVHDAMERRAQLALTSRPREIARQ